MRMELTLVYHDRFIQPKGTTRKVCKPAPGYAYVTESRFEEFCFNLPLGRYYVEGAFNAPQIVTRTRGRYTYRDAQAIPHSAPAPVQVHLP